MNLLALAERWGEVMGQTAVSFIQERCLHMIDKFTACTACQTICPVDAIHFGPPPLFSESVCQQCRACLPVCPMGAYSADDEVEALLKCASCIDVKTCEIVCELNPNVGLGYPDAAAVRVRGCLAGLGVSAYLGLVNQGFEQIVVRLDACADCPWGMLQPQIEVLTAQAQHTLAAWKLDRVLICDQPDITNLRKRPYWHAGSPPISRRDLFRWRGTEKERQPQKKNEAVGDNNPFRERLRILRAFGKLPPPNSDSVVLENLGFALISVTDECTACGVCSRACPTDALQMAADANSFQLLFTPQACIDCNICSHVCTPQAITITPAFRYDQIFSSDADQILQQGTLTHCKKCNSPFAARPDSQLCPACEFRRQNRFGSTMPPGLAANQMKKNLTGARRIEL